MKTITLPYWGHIIGLVSRQPADTATKKEKTSVDRSLFITRMPTVTHTEQTEHVDTSRLVLYRLDNVGEQVSLSTAALPCAMDAITQTADDRIILLGVDGHLYQTDWQAEKITQISSKSLLTVLPSSADSTDNDAALTADKPQAVGIQLLQQAIAVLYPKHIVIYPLNNLGDPSDLSDDTQDNNQTAVAPIVQSYPDVHSESRQSATAMASASDGEWLVVGDDAGMISSYQWLSDTQQLIHSSSKPLHQGRVNALCFEPVSQYFFSAGTDKQLYRTHVQGELHAIDRAKSSGHSQMITALNVSDTRLFTAADDRSIKSWAFDKGQPSTCKENLNKTQLLTYSRYAEKPALLAIGTDQSIRFVPIEAAQNSKLSAVAHVIEDGYQRIQQLLTDNSHNSEAAFNEAMTLLDSQADGQTLGLVSRLLDSQTNKQNNKQGLTTSRALQLTQWLASTTLEARLPLLEAQLSSARASSIRLTAFNALAEAADKTRTNIGHQGLPAYLERALESRYEDVVAAALQGYLKAALHNVDDQPRVLAILQDALSHQLLPIRRQALASLERLIADNSPRADLMALDSQQADVIQAGLIRLYQRGLLGHPEVSRQLMLLQSHRRADIRQTAFYVTLLSQPELIEALKQQAEALGDAQLLRTLTDFDDFRLLRGTIFDAGRDRDDKSSTDGNEILNTVIGAQFKEEASNTAKTASDNGQSLSLSLDTQGFVTQAEQAAATTNENTPQKKGNNAHHAAQTVTPATLSNDSLEPLLQNLSNHYEDISFRAAYALACLQDTRAFGTLIRFMHHDNDTMIRAGVATALGHLRMAGGQTILPTLLDDSDASVRKVAMTALGKLTDDPLSWVTVGFASKHQDIHERALAILLTQVLNDQKAVDAADLSAILKQTLNNPFTSIRLEAVKVIINRELTRQKAPITSVIALLQESLFEDVHQAALEEWQRVLLQSTAKAKAATTVQQQRYQAALDLLFADNFAPIRKQAFETASKHSKRFGFSPLMLSALTSPYDDIKRVAMETVQQVSGTAQLRTILPALMHLLADKSTALRQQALNVALTLVSSNEVALAEYDQLITAALASPYPDIQLTVAQLLASQTGHYEAKAYEVFKQYLETDMPVYTQKDEFNDAYKQWHKQISESLSGVALLSEPQKYQAFDWYAKYLHHPDADFKALAPNLMYIVTAADADLLATWQKDERPIVRQSASLALAVWGDARGQYFFSRAANKSSKTGSNNTDSLRHMVEPMGPIDWLQARAGIGISNAKSLRELFETAAYAPAARLLLIFNTLTAETASPEMLTEALSFSDNDTANVYAHVLARASLPINATWAYLSEHLSQKISHLLSAHSGVLKRLAHSGDTEHTRLAVLRTVDVAHVQQLAFFTQHEHPLMRTQAVRALCHLSELLAHDRYDDATQVFEAIQTWLHQSEGLSLYQNAQSTPSKTWQQGLSTLFKRQKSTDNPKANLKNSTAHSTSANNHTSYQTLAFGAWLGVIRDNDSSHSSSAQAIRGLMWLAAQPPSTTMGAKEHHNDWADSVSRVLLPLLHHGHSEIRELAWDSLLQLPIAPARVADYAMSTTYRDMIDRGLQWLVAHNLENANNTVSTDINADSNQQLVALLGTTHHVLAEAAYELLYTRVGHLPASVAALKTDSLPLLRQVIGAWQRVPVRIDHPIAMDMNTPATPEQTQRSDKLSFLSQARYCHDWQARYQVFTQLVDFDDILLMDTSLLPDLFALLTDGADRREQNQAFGLITTVMTAYQRLLQTTDTPWAHFDKANLISSTQTAYTKMFALLDNAALKLSADSIYQQMAELRDPQLIPHLQTRLQQLFASPEPDAKQARQQLFDALITLSGYDQPIKDYFGKQADQSWQTRQHPRDLNALLSLFNLLMRYGDYNHAGMLVNALAWVPAALTHAQPQEEAVTPEANQTNEADTATVLAARVDTALLLSYEQLPAKYLPNLIQAVAYRAKRRHEQAVDASLLIDILKKALMNKETQVQFLAAEGLAHCGSSEGLSILMATADYHDNGDIRRRSVLAIGEMMRRTPADAGTDSEDANQTSSQAISQSSQALYKAYDKLIKLAEDDEHYLQDVACEALGHIAQGGEFEYSAQIFALLKANLANPELLPYNDAIKRWLNGLRWLDTAAAWEQIRQHIERQRQAGRLFEPQYYAISLLAHRDSPDNKALLLNLLTHYNRYDDALKTAYSAAQKLWGCREDQVYDYDWAVIQNSNEVFIKSAAQASLKRIISGSTIETLAPFITNYGPQLSAPTLAELQNALLASSDMTDTQLAALLEHPDAQTQQLGLRYLTQYPDQYLNESMQHTLYAHLSTAQQAWQTVINTVRTQPSMMHQQTWLTAAAQVTTTMTQLLWLICRYTTPNAAVFTWLTEQLTASDNSHIATLAAAVNQWWQQALLALLARPNAEEDLISTLSTAVQSSQMTLDNQALLTTLLTRLAGNDTTNTTNNDTNDTPAITQQQLVHWIKAKDAAALYHCAQDHDVDTSIRERAIEALGWLHDSHIGTWLESLMTDKRTDADLQKLAYKVLRRWQRAMSRAQQKRPAAPQGITTNRNAPSKAQQSSQGEG